MKFLLVLSVLCFSVAAITAKLITQQFINPAHPGKCVVDDKVLSPGEEVDVKPHCGLRICREDSWIADHICPVEDAPLGYELGDPIQPAARYPDCCRRKLVRV